MYALPFSNLDRLNRLLRPSTPAYALGGPVPPNVEQPLQKKKAGLFPQPQKYGQMWKQQGMNPFQKALSP